MVAMRMKNKIKVNVDLQIGAMKSHYPEFIAQRISTSEVHFRGKLRAIPDMPYYKVRIEYRGNKPPKVYVTDPVLVENAPHTYYKTGNLCLYYPQNYHWRGDKLIAKEIVPWTIAWIYFYEVWLDSGKWFGPEVPHSIHETKKEDDE